jgi:hypothetical protein
VSLKGSPRYLALSYLGNDLQIPLVGLGTKEAMRAVQADPQLANRFEPVALPPWQLNQDFQMLLASFERVLPLRHPSRLADEQMARKLLALSEGSLGEQSVTGSGQNSAHVVQDMSRDLA